ncbi:hypothetical protein WUBG_12819 [Wuchereria bancrofti]|uniref:Uncharacterized protein n=1 Tax=Wuchereria bancrofti TaxID=6293 RepID=J9E217_WUCBA|nr:hypothetical protein WUBG_12819 [Wuchereria bancrofti]
MHNDSFVLKQKYANFLNYFQNKNYGKDDNECFQRQQYVKKWSHPGIHLLNLTNLDDGTNWMMDDGTNWMILIRLYEFLLTAVEKMTARLRRPYQCISTRFDITGIIKAFNTGDSLDVDVSMWGNRGRE